MGDTQVDIIIPTYCPPEHFTEVLDALEAQTLKPGKIILINTDEAAFRKTLGAVDFASRYPNVRIRHIAKKEFDHGGTRRRAIAMSEAPIFVMMTQDAVPANRFLIERLVGSLTSGKAAVSYARQLADDHSGVIERFSREFNYPEKSVTKTERDLKTLGIKTFFCSDVCAAYRRDLYDRLGGFVTKTIFNEDMIFAAKVIRAGYAIRYQADAEVIHSHNYTCAQQFHRNFDLGVSQAQHPEVFAKLSSESEGKRLVKEATAHLVRSGRVWKLPGFWLQCFCKYAGYLLGKHYRMLPRKLVLKCTGSPWYWN